MKKRSILLIVSLGILCMSFSSPEKFVFPVSVSSEVPYGPQFPGGNEALIKFFNANLQYPEEAIQKNEQRSITVFFTVNADGTLTDIRPELGSSRILREEVIRVINKLPSFIPDTETALDIQFRYSISVCFKLRKAENGEVIPQVYIEQEEIEQEKTDTLLPQEKEEEEEDATIFTVVESYPEFPGGQDSLIKFISGNVRYPEKAQQTGKEGKVIYKFTVNLSGEVKDIILFRGIDPYLDREALRVIHSMPRWKAINSRSKGRVIRCTIPINFRFKDNQEEINTPINKVPQLSADQEGDIKYILDNGLFFPGGDEAFIAYINKNLRYPENAQKNGIQGKVICSFFILQDGSVSNVEVIRKLDPDLDKEAIRVLENMPKWAPGKARGKVIRVRYTVPVVFRLE